MEFDYEEDAAGRYYDYTNATHFERQGAGQIFGAACLHTEFR